jgi:hypothetical protein
MSKPRATVVFRSDAFNTTEVRPYCINPGCFGDDVVQWFAERFREAGAEITREPGQEDLGWYIDFAVAGIPHCLVIGFRPDDEQGGAWIGTVERDRGLLASMLGLRSRGITFQAVDLVHAILSKAPEITSVNWHHTSSFHAGDEERGSAHP